MEIRNLFLRRTFGRYLSDDVVSSLLESDEGLEIRGERRRVSILVADLRGFTSLTEALAPDEIVSILNNYLATMADVIQEYHGTVDEFLGDAILAHFGALTTRDDDAERAVACAIAMQLAIEDVNRINRERGLPDVEMGIGVATGDVIVGNLGSEKRSKHTAIGSAVNLASRIEGYTLGGEILVSQATFEDVDGLVHVDRVRESGPRASRRRSRSIEWSRSTASTSSPSLRNAHCSWSLPSGYRFALRSSRARRSRGTSTTERLPHSPRRVPVILSDAEVPDLAELRIEIIGPEGAEGVCYAKVVDRGAGLEAVLTVRFSTRALVLAQRASPKLDLSKATQKAASITSSWPARMLTTSKRSEPARASVAAR